MAGEPAAERAAVQLRRAFAAEHRPARLGFGGDRLPRGDPAGPHGRVNSVARAVALLAYPLGPLVAGFLLASSACVVAAVVLARFVVLALVTTVNRSIRSAPSFEEVTAEAVS
jgi:hypothetical protein